MFSCIHRKPKYIKRSKGIFRRELTMLVVSVLVFLQMDIYSDTLLYGYFKVFAYAYVDVYLFIVRNPSIVHTSTLTVFQKYNIRPNIIIVF